MSCGRDHLLGRDLTLDEVGHRRVDEAPGTARVDLMPSAASSLFIACVKLDDARPWSRE